MYTHKPPHHLRDTVQLKRKRLNHCVELLAPFWKKKKSFVHLLIISCILKNKSQFTSVYSASHTVLTDHH